MYTWFPENSVAHDINDDVSTARWNRLFALSFCEEGNVSK